MSIAYQSEYVISEPQLLNEVRRISIFLDSKYRLPFGWKVGWDGILGLVPGIGDAVTNLASFYIIYKAALLGCPPSVILRMGLNLVIDNVLDAVPLVGNIFDFIWKANLKNIALLEEFLKKPHQATRRSKVVLAATFLFVMSVLIGCLILTFYLTTWIFGYLKAW